jgi:hypothetical protein
MREVSVGRLSLRLLVAILTFITGVAAASVRYLRRPEPAKPQRAVSIEPPSRAASPDEANASDGPCAYPRPSNRIITPEEAVLLAECFITQNGYTDLPPVEDKSRLTPESVYPGTDATGMRMRHDSLERRAHGFMRSGRFGGGWTVTFRYRTKPDVIRFYGDRLSTIGRAVTMDDYGKRMRVEHQDFALDFPELQKLNR